MIEWTIPNASKYNSWFYYKVKLESSSEEEVDLITWKQIILKALKNYYGLLGESKPFDLMHRPDEASVIIRCQKDDKDTFTNALLLSNGTIEGEPYSLTTLSKSAYLTGVI